ncbi:HAD family hydrolase [Arenibacterium sp. CAU 1754]
MTADLVIFDCDGVLVDSEATTLELIAADLRTRGLDLSAGGARSLFLGGTMDTARDAAVRMGADLPEAWVDHMYGVIYARLEQGVPVIPGVLDLIERIEDAGMHIAVASNGPMQKMRHSLTPSGLWDRLQGRIYSREHFAPKPAPDMLLHAIDVTGVDKTRAVMIDDSAPGCRAARNAGVRCFGFATEGQDASLAAEGADVVDRMETIAGHLGLG